jgi:hypothetical protein
MISNKEIWAYAATLLRRFGEGASAHAGQRADALLAIGDVEGHRTWIRILERINQLEKIKPDDEQMLQ